MTFLSNEVESSNPDRESPLRHHDAMAHLRGLSPEALHSAIALVRARELGSPAVIAAMSEVQYRNVAETGEATPNTFTDVESLLADYANQAYAGHGFTVFDGDVSGQPPAA